MLEHHYNLDVFDVQSDLWILLPQQSSHYTSRSRYYYSTLYWDLCGFIVRCTKGSFVHSHGAISCVLIRHSSVKLFCDLCSLHTHSTEELSAIAFLI